MDHPDRELGQAWEEITFWRDYLSWWNREHGDSPQPRIREALDRAEARYARAVLLYNMRQIM